MTDFRYPTRMKPEVYRSRKLVTVYTNESHYRNWEAKLDGYWWSKVEERFGESIQSDLLEAMAAFGVACYQWDDVFRTIYNDIEPFHDLSRALIMGELEPDFMYFADLLAVKEMNFLQQHLPPYYPEWLEQYGYTQQAYIKRLDILWLYVPEAYYIPWPTTRFGKDSPQVARIRKLGEEARREIDLVGKYARTHF